MTTEKTWLERYIDERIREHKASGAIHAACEDYRAAATIVLEHDRADDLISHRVAVPMLVLWAPKP
jgi:haloacetate dehalogenase